MRYRPQLILLAGALALAAVTAPLGDRAVATDRWVVVQRGQTLSEIAAQQGVSVLRLVELNDLADPNRIYAGQRLRVRAEGVPRTAPPPGRQATTYRVAYGNTLSGIALRFRVTVEAIARANGIADVSFIRAGQLLRIPGAVMPASNGSNHRSRSAAVHRVVYGDTLWSIAVRYGTSMSAIARANGIADTSFIRAGQLLRIPGAGRDRAVNPPSRGRVRLGGPTAAMPLAMAALVSERRQIGRMIVAEARRQDVPAAFALAVAWQESGWQPRVVSSAGAVGVMQLLPSTGDWVGSTMLGQGVNLWDPAQNIRAGVRLLKHYLVRYGGDRAMVLAAYYQGQSATDRYGVYPVSRSYIASVLWLQRAFAG